jgi:DNA-binding response OmpR family regulator
MQTVLVIDDDVALRDTIGLMLEKEGFRPALAGDGKTGFKQALTLKPDLLLVDLRMPGLSGIEVCKQIRAAGMKTPLIVLSAIGEEMDKVLLLEIGADDYVVKPFGMQELLARIRAALRRRLPEGQETNFTAKDFAVDFEARLVTVRGRDVHLTPKEFQLLRHLVLNVGKPLTHRRLLQAVWGPDYGDEPEYLRVMINQLRKKLESDPARPKLILTEPWVGYRFQAPREPKHSSAEEPKD